MEHRGHHHLVLFVALIAAVLAGCGGGDGESAQFPTAEEAPPAAEVQQVAVLSADSTYVEGLCSIDYFDPDLEDPLGWLLDQLEALETTSTEEAAERSMLIERMERVASLDEQYASEDLMAVGAVLAARCSP